MNVWTSLADRIRAELRQRGLDQKTLAVKAGINPKTLQRLNAGTAISKAKLILIEKALDLPGGELTRGLDIGGRSTRQAKADITSGGQFLAVVLDGVRYFEIRGLIGPEDEPSLRELAQAFDQYRPSAGAEVPSAVQGLEIARRLDGAITDLASRGWLLDLKERMRIPVDGSEPDVFDVIEFRKRDP